MASLLSIQKRISLLSERDPVGNANIINKLKRKARKLKNEEQ